MRPQNRTKKKQLKPATEEVLNLITLDEMKAKELKYFNQLMELQKCLSFIDDAQLEIRSLNEQELLQDKWQNYLSCNPLPKPFVPPDIRLFYSKLKHMEKENIDKNISWLLSVNERSILTQDIYCNDLTRRKLNVTLRENIGEQYNNYIKNSLQVLHRIENFLDDDVEVAKCSINVFDDIMSRKFAVQDEIKEFMDRFTYRIISSENLEMKSIDSISAEYFFNANDFEIHIWCLKNVAIRISHLSEPRLLANFHSIKLLLHIPSKMLKENLVIRALHMNFDHFSEKAKSFEKTVAVSGENLNAGILDLHKCLLNEWYMQMEIQAKVRHDMVKKYLEYEEQMRQYEEQMEKKKKGNTDDINTKKTMKVKKPTNEPLALGNDVFPDTYEDFLREEQKQYEHFCKSVYDPGLLDLSPDEINLRKYLILGGIYQMYYIEKPIYNEFNSFSMTWHHNEAKLNINKEIRILSDSRLSKQSRRSTRRMTIYEAENKYVDPNMESPWFVVTIELPQYLCFWGEPVACHFEETTRNVKKVKPVKLEESEDIIEKRKIETESQFNFNSKSHTDLTDVNKLDSLANPDLYTSLYLQDFNSLKRSHVAASQHIFRDSFYRDSLASCLLHKRKSEHSPGFSNSLAVNDFLLTNILTKPQIRHMERHITPRIISSYKFPKEIQLEELELLSKKPRRKGGRIIRRRNDDIPLTLSGRQFALTDCQNNPERVFANYPKLDLLNIISYIKELNLDDDQKEPETFAQLLNIVNEIKREYRLRHYKIMDLKPLEQEIITHNKRIKQMLRKKELTSSKRPPNQKSIKFDSKFSEHYENEIAESEKAHSLTADNLSNKNESSVMFYAEEELELETYSHWTTKYILKSEFDRKNRKIVLHTDRLGNFGFAFKRYEHFPFKNWSMEPNKDDPENEVIFTLDTKYVRCVLYITSNGIRGHVMELTEAYVRNPYMYLVIEKPIKDYKEFKQLFKAKHLNIFAEHDARYYIENGYFSEKHLSNELHTYNCMAIHSTQMYFNSSLWNRFAQRRDITLHFKHYQDVAGNLVEVRITPGEAFFVEIEEVCSEVFDVIKLDYKLTWRNFESYSDLHHLIVSMYPTAADLRCKNPKLICCIRDLLSEIRPLSFS